MATSYKKLFKLLIDRDMMKKDLMKQADLNPNIMNKLYHGKEVDPEILTRICDALDCTTDDIMEITPDQKR